jgi:hypothetical protein
MSPRSAEAIAEQLEAHARNSNFSAALAFHAKGYNVVPQAAVDKKHPAVKWKGFQDRLVERDELDGWKHLFENGVGFVTGAMSGVIVIESDGPGGEAVLAEFGREHGPLPDTLTIRSGSGRGLHRHFKHPGFTVKTVTNPSIKLDVKGDKGYCVLPPSLHKCGRRYEVVHDAEPAPLPDGLLEFIEMKAVEACDVSPEASAAAASVETTARAALPPPPVDTMRAMLHHLADRKYFADRGGVVRDANGCFAKVGWIETGMALKPAYGDEVGFDLWSVTHIDDQARADAPAQWASFATEPEPGHVTIGTIIKAAKDAGFVFPTLRTNADDDPMRAAMRELDSRYFVAKVGGVVFVFDEQDEKILTDAMTFTAFQQFNAGHKINNKPVAAAWLTSSGRRTYSSLVFDPSGNCPEGSYNTWHGLAVEPKKGKCGKIITHIRDVWCSGDTAQFEYVMRWLALLVQRPWMKPEVALVLRSKEGTGKTIIVQVLLDIFGVHGFTTAQKDQVAGRFNGHLFDKVLVVLEEAFFAGDPAAVAAAKALVTNLTLSYEAKGKDTFSAPNYAHVITLTNNEWAVPAGADARRWMVLNVSEARMRDHPYFTALANEIKTGGREAFLDYLMSVNLDGWNPRAVPRSDALHAQQVETLRRSDPVAAWWLDALSEGEFTVEGGAVAWAPEISAADMQQSYAMATRGARNAPAFDGAAKKLRKLVPTGALTKVRKSQNADRFFHYRLPDLSEARQHFTTVKGIDPCAI